MKLATYRDGSRDGQLVVVSRDGALAHYATGIADTLQQALDDWNFIAPQLRDLALTLEQGKARHAFAFDARQCMAPLPRAVGWLAPDDDTAEPRPWRSDALWGPMRPLPAVGGSADVGPALAVLCGDVAPDADAAVALEGVRLVALACHWRRAPDGDAPHAPWGVTVAPCVVTPDALGAAWREGRLTASVTTAWNGRKLGIAEGADQTVSFGALLAAAARGRGLAAGVAVAGGVLPTPQVAGDPPAWPRGYATLAMRRAAERLTLGREVTPWLTPGDRVQIEARLPDGSAPFGAIDVVWAAPPHNDGVTAG
ncbi:Fumarylacetoacetate (FAA) hydrolase family protein [Tepidimonas thermarum]|uniref:Fumarylacetoacetate (FAA) hydrolase family protein n=1 Tax=Tepidimonas thermarum TaxID=335431 RepID=A0A554X3L0_9BURK|nr:fumarylacetoacetate hydrolase family protein [Tepidimonas thermarum]TSE30431.1 Fumarylacetoacetate (FAA) hydrolase family protein [Tepidimonas thermarum]